MKSICLFFVRFRSLHNETLHDAPVMAMDVSPKESAIVTGSADSALLYNRVKVSRNASHNDVNAVAAASGSLYLNGSSPTLASDGAASPRLQPRSLLSESLFAGKQQSHADSNLSKFTTSSSSPIISAIDYGEIEIRKKFQFKLPKEGTLHRPSR